MSGRAVRVDPDDPETIERAAKAIYAGMALNSGSPEHYASVESHYRSVARAVLAAVTQPHQGGPEMSESAPTKVWSPRNTETSARLRKERIRNQVWEQMRSVAQEDDTFKDAMNAVGLFTFMHAVDIAVDVIMDEQVASAPLLVRLDIAEDEIQFLRKRLDEARQSIGAETGL